MGKHHKIVLKDEQRSILQRYAFSQNNKNQIATKAQILLLTDRSQPSRIRDAEIIKRLGTSICTIVRTRRQFCEKGLDAVISRKSPKQRKPKYDKDVLRHTVLALIANPPIDNKRWTIRLITEQLKCIGIHVSQTSVYNTLHKMNIKLH